MSAPSPSVFISYAREDLAATRRIADALSAFEVEVWFDQDGLEGGDQWDQKIRRQIKECSLFIPIISVQTQARREAYFRLEWKLAEERTHLMAEGTAFLLPIAIDDLPEAGALVPESFRRTQWTRLPRGVPNTQFVDRVRTLLEQQRPLAAPAPAQPNPEVRRLVTAPPAGRARQIWPIGTLITALALAAGGWWWSGRMAGPKPAGAAPTAPMIADNSIAVLPFTNMSEDKDNAFFADGVHEDVLTQLALIGDLKVTSRTSVMEYRNTAKKIRQIGVELGVATLLEGSVRRVGDRVRVTAQLIDSRSDRHLWAKTFDRELKDVFAIQAELAIEIARSLEVTLSPQIQIELARVPTQNMAAYELLMRQQAANNRESVIRPDIEKNIELLQQVVALDPGLAIAWARLGTMHARQIFDFEDLSPERQSQAQTAIDRALALAPTAPEVRLELGNFFYYAHRDYARAEAIYGEILGMAPHNVEALAQTGYVLRREGRFRESNVYLEKVMAQDPRHVRALGSMYFNYLRIRDYVGAKRIIERMIKLRPTDLSFQAQRYLVEWMESGRFDAYDVWRSQQVSAVPAIASMDFRRALARRDFAAAELLLSPMRGAAPATSLDALFWRATGGLDPARRALVEATVADRKDALRKQPDKPNELAELALLHAVLGEKEVAWRELNRACEIIPASRDAFAGTDVAAYGARLHALLGERTQALQELKRTMRTSALNMEAFTGGEGAATDLAFFSLWDDPEFKAIVHDPANKAPLF